MLMLANSLLDGFLLSNGIGKGIVIGQLVSSVVMVAVIVGKFRELTFTERAMTRFLRDFQTGQDIMEYYINRRPTICIAAEAIYKATCERLMKLFAPDMRAILAGRPTEGAAAAALSSHEIELVRGTCDHVLDEETIRVESSMSVVATVVSLSPMLGLLGTVWGVLDAFAAMGSAGSANLATIAPSISSALVTTVVGLLIAIPGVCAFSYLNSRIRRIGSTLEGFADELMGRIKCEFGRSA